MESISCETLDTDNLSLGEIMKKLSGLLLVALTNFAMHAMYRQNPDPSYPPYQQNVPGNQAHQRYLTIDPSSAQITPARQQMPQRPTDINAAARGFFEFIRTELEMMVKEPELSNDNKGLARRIIEILLEAAAQGNKRDNYMPESPTTSRR